MNFKTFVIIFTALFFILYGLVFVFAPQWLALIVTEQAPTTASAIIDFRATYGGMTVAIGAVLIYLFSIKQVNAALVMTAVTLLCMAVGRGFGLMVDGQGNIFMWLYFAAEIVGVALAMVALKLPE